MNDSIPDAFNTAGDKALKLNLDRSIYGTFAEIGAGQEVANCFFRASATAGTVAKSISAYDMEISDALYGKTQRYVSKERVVDMVNYEYELLEQRLGGSRGEASRFFAFANTVAARSFSRSGRRRAAGNTGSGINRSAAVTKPAMAARSTAVSSQKRSLFSGSTMVRRCRKSPKRRSLT